MSHANRSHANRSHVNRHVLQAVIAGVVAAVLLAVMGGLPVFAQWGDPPPASEEPEEQPAVAGSSAEACDLVTEAEAVEALGSDVTRIGDATQCTYIAGDLSGRSVSVAQSPLTPTQDGVLETAMRQLAQVLSGELQPVDLGQEAWLVTSDALAEMSVVSEDGDSFVLVLSHPSGMDRAAATGTLTDLAETAIQRL